MIIINIITITMIVIIIIVIVVMIITIDLFFLAFDIINLRIDWLLFSLSFSPS